MKKIIKNGLKPEINFKCSFCKSVWSDDEWSFREEPTNLLPLGFMFGGTNTRQEKPMSVCPVCNWKSFNVTEDGKEHAE